MNLYIFTSITAFSISPLIGELVALLTLKSWIPLATVLVLIKSI